MKTFLLALTSLAALAAPAVARERAPVAAGDEARIAFADFGGIRSFHAEDTDRVYIQDRHRNWYLARLIGPCFGLPWAHRIGVDTRGSSSFDRFSAIIVERERCQIESLVRSEPPPRKASKHRG